ncbi:MAG: glutamine--fructose-6-phosphate transaminase (isomerizing) [Kiritimatiellia bacterium]
MCGIVGYIGPADVCDILLSGLRRLEYRGYDSAGIAINSGGELHIVRSVGKVARLAERVAAEWPDALRAGAKAGIAHTRWATHGAPTEENAHPHADQSGRVLLVHNGIIENYASLRRQLEGRGHTFQSQTDTEVLAHLVGECYRGKLFEAVSQALKHVEGTYGIAVISAAHPGEIVVARNGSPLLVGLCEGAAVIASDASAVIAHTRQVIYLQDGDVAAVRADGVDIRNLDQIPVDRAISQIDWDDTAVEKGGHAHFMRKEIWEQPEALQNTIRGRLDERAGCAILSGLNLSPREMAAVNRIVLVACGTSLYAGMTGRYALEGLAGIPTDAEQAAEFRYRNPIIGPDSMVVAVSQSGETADTLAAVREAHHKGALVAGVCNVVGSTIAREAARGIYLHAGPEIGVASTKAFSSQVLVLVMLALAFGRGRRLSREEGAALCREMAAVPELVRRVLAQDAAIAALAARLAPARSAFFIGRGVLYPAALEGALKLKEISYVHAEGYHAAELKHGPIALLDEQTPVVALLNDVPGRDKMLGNVQECLARHAPVLAVASEGDAEVASLVPDCIFVPRTGVYTTPILAVVALQLLAYHVARLRGCPIDQPRNLAKSVTVE